MERRLYQEFPADISSTGSDFLVVKDEFSDRPILDCPYSQQSTYAEHCQFAYALPSHYSSLATNQLALVISSSASHYEVLFVTIVDAHTEPIVFYDDSRQLIDRLVQRYANLDARGTGIPRVSNQFNNCRHRA